MSINHHHLIIVIIFQFSARSEQFGFTGVKDLTEQVVKHDAEVELSCRADDKEYNDVDLYEISKDNILVKINTSKERLMAS